MFFVIFDGLDYIDPIGSLRAITSPKPRKYPLKQVFVLKLNVIRED